MRALLVLPLLLAGTGCSDDPILAGQPGPRAHGDLMFFRTRPAINAGFPLLHYTTAGPGDQVHEVSPALGSATRSATTRDGEWLAYEAGGNVWVRRLRASHASRLTPSGYCDSQPRWLDDGRRVMMMRENCYTFPSSNRAIVIVSVETGNEVRLSAPSAGGFPSPSPDGELVVWFSTVRSRGLELLHADGSLIRALQPDRDTIRSTTSPVFAPSGDRIAFIEEFVLTTYEDAVRIIDLQGNVVKSWVLPGKGFQPAWSPDGSQLAVCVQPIVDGEVQYYNARIEIWDLGTDEKRAIPNDGGSDCYPSWGR